MERENDLSMKTRKLPDTGESGETYDVEMSSKNPTLQDYFDLVIKAGNKKCGFCNYPFLLRNLQHYTHSGGWPLEGSFAKQWIYIHCSNCKYDWAISKLGVPK